MGLSGPVYDRTTEEWAANGGERVNDMQHMAAGWRRTRGRCSKDTASVDEIPALPTELPGRPRKRSLKCLLNSCHQFVTQAICFICSLSSFSPIQDKPDDVIIRVIWDLGYFSDFGELTTESQKTLYNCCHRLSGNAILIGLAAFFRALNIICIFGIIIMICQLYE